ncbi:hypothetical protein DL93DRAFT_2092339, partial [Clavulina sp. PMI_390]
MFGRCCFVHLLFHSTSLLDLYLSHLTGNDATTPLLRSSSLPRARCCFFQHPRIVMSFARMPNPRLIYSVMWIN